MKIREIIAEHEFPKAKTHIRNTEIPDLYDYDGEDAYVNDYDEPPEKGNPHADNPDIETLGTGAFATAYRHKKNPYDVTKGSKATNEPDGFLSFFDALSKDKEAQSNPYFPRFRNMNKFKGKYSGKQSYITKVEPLEKYQDLSKAERTMLANKLFNEQGIDVLNHYFEEENRKLLYRRNNPQKENYPGEKLAWAVECALVNDTWADELRWSIEDKKFLQAIEFLQAAAEEYNFTLDMHFNNLMVRRTSVGPQLVFNDPFGESSGDQDSEEDWDGF